MPFNGTGTFISLAPPTYPAVPGTVIKADDYNDVITDLQGGLTNCLTRDGQSPPTADIPMGSRKLTNLAAATSANDAVRLAQLNTSATATVGAGIVAYDSARSYAAGTVGAWMKAPVVPTQAQADNSTKAASTAYVDAAKAAAILEGAVPLGTVIQRANGYGAPTGYLYCNGQAVSRATYSALFGFLATLYGAGDGSTTFNVPDYRGMFLRGQDNGRGLAPAPVGFGGFVADSFKSHTHTDGADGSFPGSTTGGGAFFVNQAGNGAGSSTGATGGAETAPVHMEVAYYIKY